MDRSLRLAAPRGLRAALCCAATAAAATASATSIPVTSTADDLTVDGNCTLREAVVAANTNAPVDACPAGAPSPTVDAIVVPAGTYVLTLAGLYENAGLTGDLDLTDDVELRGAGADVTVVDAAGLDRVLEIQTPQTARILDVTLRGGNPLTAHGGAVYIGGTGKVLIQRATIRDSLPGLFGFGGAIYQEAGSFLELFESTIRDNEAGGFPALFAEGQGNVVNSTVSGNRAVTYYPPGGGPPSGIGAAIGVENDARYSIVHTTISDNVAELADWDHDVFASFDGTILLSNTLVDGSCYAATTGTITSLGGNVESPGATCPLTGPGDQPGVASPGLVAIAANGGTTETHELLASSAGKDAALASACPARDQRGVARPQSGACDVGSFERRPGCVAAVVSGAPGGRTVDPVAALVLALPLAVAAARRRLRGAERGECRARGRIPRRKSRSR